MKTFTIQAKFIFTGTITVNAKNINEAREHAKHVHLNLSAGIETQYPRDIITDWAFPVTANQIIDETGPQYVLYGKDAAECINNDEFEELLERLTEGEEIVFELKEWPWDEPVNEIMGHCDGWSDWCFLTKEQYDILSEI